MEPLYQPIIIILGIDMSIIFGHKRTEKSFRYGREAAAYLNLSERQVKRLKKGMKEKGVLALVH